AFGSRQVLPEDRSTHNLYSLRLERLQGNWGPPNYFLLQKSFHAVPSASAVLVSPRPMRLIRLVMTPLHPRDQRQHPFNRIQAQRSDDVQDRAERRDREGGRFFSPSGASGATKSKAPAGS